jgi:hypothetical protein
MGVDGDDWVPVACTLPAAEQPLRMREFDELFAQALVGVDRLAPTILRLSLAGGKPVAARARNLTARESECCAFFTFTVTVGEAGVKIDVTVPAAQMAVLEALAERAARPAA